ncbi:HK97 gp10 family phage protein [Listeria booriae]|uniref:HK97 gp10 family phage protein n=1 Tax=Listeria booriae TaxID=1552123 RepID=UPI0016279A78|nr:HK97 gp10 family phage protein [Listeria booriae]MBC1801120.1 HK97 gp10 family phage protein [Listeria booriae]
MVFNSFKDNVIKQVRGNEIATASVLGNELRQASLPITPVLTGDLRRSSTVKIVFQKNAVVARVSSNTAYAKKQYYTNANLPRWYETGVAYSWDRLGRLAVEGMKL